VWPNPGRPLYNTSQGLTSITYALCQCVEFLFRSLDSTHLTNVSTHVSNSSRQNDKTAVILRIPTRLCFYYESHNYSRPVFYIGRLGCDWTGSGFYSLTVIRHIALTRLMVRAKFWWAVRVSNPGPSPCKSVALPLS
jgi:hypothetical protein